MPVFKFHPIGAELEPSADDRQFFRRHRLRHYRLRLATKAEIAAVKDWKIAADEFLFVAVQKITTSRRLRMIFLGSPELVNFMRDEKLPREMFECAERGVPPEDFANIITELGMCEMKLNPR